jgi:hypothetical protein
LFSSIWSVVTSKDRTANVIVEKILFCELLSRAQNKLIDELPDEDI